MNNAFERFLAGEDALARAIREQPAFEPGEAREERLLAALAELPQATAQDLAPPATLEAAFLQEMHAVQRAQSPRRDALLSRLQAGEKAADVLGHPVSAATQAWLAGQQPATAVPEPRVSLRTNRRWRELGGLVFAGAVLAAIGMQFYFPSRQPQQAEIAVNERASAPQASPPLQLAEQKAAPPPADTTRSAAPVRLQRPVPQPARQPDVPDRVDPAAQSTGEPASQLALAELSRGIMLERSRSLTKEIPELDIAAIESAKSRMPGSPAPLAEPEAAAEVTPDPKSRMTGLQENPRDVARELPSDWAGQILVLYAADPQSPAVQDWAGQLRAALPPGTRLELQSNASLGAETLRLGRP